MNKLKYILGSILICASVSITKTQSQNIEQRVAQLQEQLNNLIEQSKENAQAINKLSDTVFKMTDAQKAVAETKSFAQQGAQEDLEDASE